MKVGRKADQGYGDRQSPLEELRLGGLTHLFLKGQAPDPLLSG